MKLKSRIDKIMMQVFDLKLEDLNPEVSVDNLNNWDSISHLDLIEALEKEFQIKFSDDQMVEILDLESIYKCLESFKK